MKQVYCEKESKIIQALHSGALGAELEKHAATCGICADTLAVSKFFQAERMAAPVQHCHSGRSEDLCPIARFSRDESWLDLNASTVNKDTQFFASLPDPDFLWWKAQLATKRLAVERATRSITLVRTISYLGLAAAGLWLVFAPGHLGSIVEAVSKNQIWPAGALSQSALFLGAGTLVFTLLGSLYLARPEK